MVKICVREVYKPDTGKFHSSYIGMNGILIEESTVSVVALSLWINPPTTMSWSSQRVTAKHCDRMFFI